MDRERVEQQMRVCGIVTDEQRPDWARLAEAVGCSAETIRNYRTGFRVPGKAIRMNFARVLGISESEIWPSGSAISEK